MPIRYVLSTWLRVHPLIRVRTPGALFGGGTPWRDDNYRPPRGCVCCVAAIAFPSGFEALAAIMSLESESEGEGEGECESESEGER